jgi:hypothetical protein
MLKCQHLHQAQGGDHMHLLKAIDIALGMATKANILNDLVDHDSVLVRSRKTRSVQPVDTATAIGRTSSTSKAEYAGGYRHFAELSIDESNMEKHDVISIQIEGGTEAKSDSVAGKSASNFHGNKRCNDALHGMPSYCAWRYAFREVF